jgi:hypothetical protein
MEKGRYRVLGEDLVIIVVGKISKEDETVET